MQGHYALEYLGKPNIAIYVAYYATSRKLFNNIESWTMSPTCDRWHIEWTVMYFESDSTHICRKGLTKSHKCINVRNTLTHHLNPLGHNSRMHICATLYQDLQKLNTPDLCNTPWLIDTDLGSKSFMIGQMHQIFRSCNGLGNMNAQMRFTYRSEKTKLHPLVWY